MKTRAAFLFTVTMLFANCVAAEESSAETRVDFSYAFATPHRITVALPDNSNKTLLDVEPGAVRMSWSYQSLMDLPFSAYVTPPANWAVKLTPQIDGQPFAGSAWTRVDGFLPALRNTCESPAGRMTLEIAGGADAALVRVTITNPGTQEARFALICESQRGFFGYNPAFVDKARPNDCLLAGWGERADRIIVFCPGADELPLHGATTLCPEWLVASGETRVAWLIRPYAAYAADLPALRAHDWEKDFTAAKEAWHALIGRAARIHVPDSEVERAFLSCLADCFIMREPVPGGRIAGTPGTDGYRAASPCEPGIIAIVLDQLGLHKESDEGYSVFYESQGDDGDWADPQGWAHLMWLAAGFKSWTAIEHYKHTRDRAYLERVYPHMLASARFHERERARTRVIEDGKKPLTYGLMPPGMGDCGLKDGDNLYGVFLPHNFWAVYADEVALESARILDRTDDIPELERICATAREDLLAALDRGAIQEDGYRWIPGVAGKTCGSRWGALNALTPCAILPPIHELVSGTIRHLESKMSPGGLPLNTGWMPEGLWVAIALDNLAEAHLVRNEGDAAAALFYATLNHGTPLFTWCEERGPLPGAAETTGDRQHLWTPVAVVRALRDMLVMEDGNVMHLARGVDREWLASGGPVGVDGASTHFGKVSYSLRLDKAAQTLIGELAFAGDGPPSAIVHLRLPPNLAVKSVSGDGSPELTSDLAAIEWNYPKDTIKFTVELH